MKWIKDDYETTDTIPTNQNVRAKIDNKRQKSLNFSFSIYITLVFINGIPLL